MRKELFVRLEGESLHIVIKGFLKNMQGSVRTMKIKLCDFCGEQIKGDPIKIIPYFQKEEFMETICIPWAEQVNRTYCRKCTAELISLMRMPVETMKRLEAERKEGVSS